MNFPHRFASPAPARLLVQTSTLALLVSLALSACGSEEPVAQTSSPVPIETHLDQIAEQQADLYATADALEASGQTLRAQADEIGQLLSKASQRATSEAAAAKTPEAATAEPDEKESKGGGGFILGLIVIALALAILRRRKARSAEEQAWRDATYSPPSYTSPTPGEESATLPEDAPMTGDVPSPES